MSRALYTLLLSLVWNQIVQAGNAGDHRCCPLANVTVGDVHLAVRFAHHIVAGLLVLAYKLPVAAEQANLVSSQHRTGQAVCDCAAATGAAVGYCMGRLSTRLADQHTAAPLTEHAIRNGTAVARVRSSWHTFRIYSRHDIVVNAVRTSGIRLADGAIAQYGRRRHACLIP